MPPVLCRLDCIAVYTNFVFSMKKPRMFQLHLSFFRAPILYRLEVSLSKHFEQQTFSIRLSLSVLMDEP